MSDRVEPTVLGPEVTFKGELTCEGPVRILGRFEGVIRGATDITTGPKSEVAANLEADTIVIEGRLRGDAHARQRLQIGAAANVEGAITAGALSIAEGAAFAGRVSIAPAGSPPPRTPGQREPMPEVVTPAGLDWLTQTAVKTPGWVKAAVGLDESAR